MANCSKRQQTIIAIVAIVIMALTRSHHVAGLNWLADASTALFFLAGLYLGPVWWFGVLLGEAALVDYAAVTWGGVSDFCITPAYGFMVLAYGALWGAGRWYARRMQMNGTGLGMLVAVVLVGGVAAEIISSGSFYVFSGYTAEPTWAGFVANLQAYMPYALESLFMYVGVAALIHVAIATMSNGGERAGSH